MITSAIPPHHPRVPQYVCATDNALRHIRTVSSQCVHCGCGLVPLVSCCLAWQTTATALLLCCNACSGGFAVALLQLCGSSAAARRPWLRFWACASARSSALSMLWVHPVPTRTSSSHLRRLDRLARDADHRHDEQHEHQGIPRPRRLGSSATGRSYCEGMQDTR